MKLGASVWWVIIKLKFVCNVVLISKKILILLIICFYYSFVIQ